ncbi:hypothetical protein JKF63_06020 [Porcisia hertigi]|uniref:DUF4456 domain-containing protein n=1 Tax=Porcisia hertigi TaxID=2761500 RepID=A0A836HVG3_9TRYP|nr:hypothetical protein JKF63_06020 [Porcisia hertigi]
MNTSLPKLPEPFLAPLQARATDSFPGTMSAPSPPPQRMVGGGTLHERLLARYQNAIEAFRGSARSFNDDVDAAQQQRIVRLQAELSRRHTATASMIAEAQQRLSQRQSEAQGHSEALQGASPDIVLAVRTDEYHCSTADDQGRARAVTLMKEDRLRLVRHLVEMRDHYRSRMEVIDACFGDIASAEEARRAHIQAAVQELMASLSRIAVTSTTESQVLAQRILHHTNEQLGKNYLAMQTMKTQLQQRELYKHQDYQHALVGVYRETQVCMAQQHMLWCIIVLRSAVFHRPEGRLQSVRAAGQLIGTMRNEAEALARGLTEVVSSLEVAQPSASTAELQACGGSGTNGWLRCFQPDVHKPQIFVDKDPRAVLEEWQMHVSILLRHCRARCSELVAHVKTDEATRAVLAAELVEHTLEDVDEIAHPLSEELVLLQHASLMYSGAEGNLEVLSLDESAGMVDDALLPLAHAHYGVLAVKESMTQCAEWAQCVPNLEKEGKWFVRFVSHGFQCGYSQFCTDAAASTGSMLVSLEGATDLLLASTGDLLGLLRGLYAQWREKELDYRDEVAQLEQQLNALEEALRQEETPAATEARYTEGLICLQSIADAHARYYDSVCGRVANATADVLRAGQACVRELSKQVGLSWVRMSPPDEVETPTATPEETISKSSSSHPPAALGGSTSINGASPTSWRESVAGTSANAEPHWRSSRGFEFIIDSVAFRFTCVTARSGGAGGADALVKADAKLQNFDGDDTLAAVALTGAAPDAAYQQFYFDLLPDLRSAQEGVALFLPQSRVSDWKEHLRSVLMEWGLSLQQHAWENWRLYTTALQREVQHRVTEALRYHRRRPATLQATVYEARLRELAHAENRADKMLSRIVERVSRLQTLKQDFLTQPLHSASDELLTSERATLLVKVREAASTNAVKALMWRHDSICTEYCTALTDRCSEMTHSLEMARSAIEEDCEQILHDRAVELRSGDASARLPRDDPVQMRVDHLRTELEETLAHSLKAIGDRQQARADEIENWKVEWNRILEHSNAELNVFQFVQEGLTRLKAQVQTLLTTAAMEEAALGAKVEALVKEVDATPATSVIDLVVAIDALFKTDLSADSLSSAGVDNKSLTTEDLKGMVERNLEVIKAMRRERVRATSACAVLGLLDELREVLYMRGCRLGVVAHPIEMWRVPPTHYVLPLALGEDETETVQSRSVNRGGSARAGRRGKDVQSIAVSTTTAAGHTVMPLSAPATYAEQVSQWTVQVLTDAGAAAQRHMNAFPGNMYRRLPGMTDGTVEELNAAVEALCLGQQERVKSYMSKGSQTFRLRVQELWNALQKTPSLLVNTLRAEATSAIVERVGAVMQPWLCFQAQSSEQWHAHKCEVKLSLAHQPNTTTLTSLTNAEATRSSSTESALQQAWARCLLELEDEVGLHVARCWTTLHSYAHLLKGLLTPQHLVATAEILEGGHHRGLRHLLELRAQHERAAAAIEGTAGAKKDPRQQETTTSHRTDVSGANASAPTRRHANAASAAAASAATGTVDNAGLVPLSQWGDVELPGLPLNTCVPLSQYNTQHPKTAVTPPMSAAAYVPTAVRIVNDGKGPQSPGSRHTSGTTSLVPSSSSGRKGQASMALDAKAAVVAEVSVPLLVPRAPLVLECVQLLRAAVQSVSEQSNDAAGVLSSAFGFYELQEEQRRQTWSLTLRDLATI